MDVAVDAEAAMDEHAAAQLCGDREGVMQAVRVCGVELRSRMWEDVQAQTRLRGREEPDS